MPADNQTCFDLDPAARPFICLILGIILCAAAPLLRAAELVPRLWEAPGAEEMVIASASVLEFGAGADGERDDTAAFQAALEAVGEAGGAVFVPAGRYAIRGHLEIPMGVTLRGAGPQLPDGGTLLLAYEGRGDAQGAPFVSLDAGAGLLDLAIHYPEQVTHAIQPYPWTVEQTGVDNATVRNVVLTNPYQGITVGRRGPCELHYITNVRMTPLKTGIALDKVYDIGRVEQVHMAPDVWIGSGLAGALTGETEATLRDWLSREATGIQMARSDWQYLMDLEIEGLAVGLEIAASPVAQGWHNLRTSNGQVYNASFADCGTAVLIRKTNHIGFSFTRCRLESARRRDALALHVSSAFDQGVVQFNHCTFAQGGSPGVLLEGAGPASFWACRFITPAGRTGDAAIVAKSGLLSVGDSLFDGEHPTVKLAREVRAATLSGNASIGKALRIENASPGDVQIGKPAPAAKRAGRAAPDLCLFPRPRPTSANLVNVKDHGARGDGTSDDTRAFRAALKAAAAAGGFVYAPSGRYRITAPLRVPTGVELRGSSCVPHHTMSMGSLLAVHTPQRDAEAEPLVTLEAGAGIRGLTVWYPEQDYQDIKPYPWAIRGLGRGVYVVDVTLVNAFRGVDLGTRRCERHLVDYLAGCPLDTGVWVGANSSGVVRNVQFNPHYWFRNTLPRRPQGNDWRETLRRYQNENHDAFRIGACSNELLLANFVYSAKTGLSLVREQAGAPQALVIAHGTDAVTRCLDIQATGPGGVRIVNFQGAAFAGKSVEREYFVVGPDVQGPVHITNPLFWGSPTRASRSSGADVTLEQGHFVVPGDPMLAVDKGCFNMTGVTIPGGPWLHLQVDKQAGTVSARGAICHNGLAIKGQADARDNVDPLPYFAASATNDELRSQQFGMDVATKNVLCRGWYGLEGKGENSWCWSHPEAELLLPVLPETTYRLTIEVEIPAQAAGPGTGLFLGESCIMPFAKGGQGPLSGRFTTPNARHLRLTVRAGEWRPSAVNLKSKDNRRLGIMLKRILLEADKSGFEAMDSRNPSHNKEEDRAP